MALAMAGQEPSPPVEPGPAAVGRGTWFLTPTPFDRTGGLDLASLRRLVDCAIAWGVDGLTVMGVMSEPATLTDAERSAALETVFDAVAGRVPVIVGCSAGGAALAAERARQARAMGAVAAMVSSPPLVRNVDQLPAFFAAVARDGGLPLVLQDEPAATGVTIPVTVLLACAAASGARCVKVEDPPTPPKIRALLAADRSLTLFGGLGGIAALHELVHGAAGTMTGFALPEVMRAIRLAVEGGREDRAARLFDRFLPLIVFEGQPGIGLAIRKEVLRRRGAIETSRTRVLPGGIDPPTSADLEALVDRIGVQLSSQRLVVDAGEPDPPALPAGVR